MQEDADDADDDTMSACKRYDLAKERIKAFSRSGIRAKTMLCLKDGPKTAADLESLIGIRSSTILHSIKEMREEDLIRKTDRGYALTNIGNIQVHLLDDLVCSIIALDMYRDFWLNHEIGSIPIGLQKQIGMLMHSEIIASDQANILKCHEHFLENLRQATEIYGVSPIIAPGHSEAIREAVERGAKVELVVTEEVLGIASQMNPDLHSALFKYDNFRLYRLTDQITVAFTVTDSILSLGFYRLDGSYDIDRDLISTGDEARAWGMRLFEYYRQRAEPVTHSDLPISNQPL